MPRLSVVVPLYNKAKYVVRALHSIARQSHRDFEVIVIDDGSTDGGAELAAGYPDKRFRIVRQPNRGPGAARNRGLLEAQGELAAFLDADDVWLPNYLQTCTELLDRGDPNVASVTCGYIDLPWGVSRESMWRRRGLSEGVHHVNASTPTPSLVYMLAYMTPCSTVARLDVLRRWGGFFEKNGARYAEDAVLWLKVLLNESVCFTFKPLVAIDRTASSLSSNYTSARPIEPFLSDPDLIRDSCPPELMPVLERFFAMRAYKTAAVLGYWGEWRKARQLVREYAAIRDWKVPHIWPALIGSTPAAAYIRRVADFVLSRAGDDLAQLVKPHSRHKNTQAQTEVFRKWGLPEL
jgi:glycosyltransferase involved in cell wall biosynthesis